MFKNLLLVWILLYPVLSIKLTSLKISFNPKFKRDPSLQNYWPFKSNVNDVIGGAHLYQGVNAGLTSDRFNQTLSALSLKNGYYKMPPGIYF